MARIEVAWEIYDLYNTGNKSQLLFKILEQVELVGDDSLDTLGGNIIEVPKAHRLIFQDGKLAR